MKTIDNVRKGITTYWERYHISFWLELVSVVVLFVSAFLGIATLVLYLNEYLGEPV